MDREQFLEALPSLVKDYQPGPHVLDKLKNLDLLMVVGPSGVGKSTIINKLGLRYVIVDTTRAARPEEKEGVDFYFRSDYDHIIKEINSGEFVQFVVGVSGDLYATKNASYPDSGLGVMAVIAEALPIFRSIGFKSTTSVFITPPSFVEWMGRLSSHKLPQDQLEKRLAEARRALHLSLLDREMHFILNDDINLALAQIRAILEGKVDFEREGQARSIALKISNFLE